MFYLTINWTSRFENTSWQIKNAEFSLILRIVVYKLSRHCISVVADATFVVCINGGNAADNTATISFAVEMESSTLVFWDKFICNDFYFKPLLTFSSPFLLNKKIHLQGNCRILNLTKQIFFSNPFNQKFYVSWLHLSMLEILRQIKCKATSTKLYSKLMA